jgi:hypothetical protein
LGRGSVGGNSVQRGKGVDLRPAAPPTLAVWNYLMTNNYFCAIWSKPLAKKSMQ